MTCMDKETKELLESSISKVIEVDVPNDEVGWGQFLKVQIEINLQQPLALVRFINFNKRKMWIPICFKKLSHFCFKCRLIWHADQGYHFLASTLKRDEGNQFWPWLCASKSYYRGVSGFCNVAMIVVEMRVHSIHQRNWRRYQK